MNRDERNKLYDWLENGRLDVYLRRLMKERLAELEAALRALHKAADAAEPWIEHHAHIEDHELLDALKAVEEVMQYERPTRKPPF